MIRNLFCITLATLLAMVLFAQSAHAQSPLSFGAKAGINIANLSGDAFDDADSRTGIIIGGVVDIGLPMLPVGLETGLYYSQQGATISESFEEFGETFDFESTLSLDYLTIPVLGKLYFGPPGPISPHIVAGPYFAYLLDAESEVTMNGMTISGDISDETESLDFGLIAGVGVDFNVGVTKLNVQARYSLGLVDIFDDSNNDDFDDFNDFNNDLDDDFVTDPDSKNRVFTITAGIYF